MVNGLFPRQTGEAKRYGGSLADHLAQGRVAVLHAQQQHERLIAAGAVWDGMDGYSFVNEVTADDLGRIMGVTPEWLTKLTDPEPTP